jgi:S1-C subfamily serine protease
MYNLPKLNLLESAKGKGGFRLILTVFLISVLCGLVAGGLSGFYFYYQTQEYLKKANLVFSGNSASQEQYLAQTSQEDRTISVIKEVAPAVVSIIITKDVPVYEQYYVNPFGNDQFFSPFEIQIPQQRQKGTEKQEIGGGTGVIISSDGVILTNKHVVLDENADYTVFNNDGKKYSAKVLARDPVQDLAIIKIDRDKIEDKDITFPVAKLGDSDKIELGQTVIAIGNALGQFNNTISVGVISGLSRTITASGGDYSETLENIIQTDAAINEGNSGGPLLNLRGEVIGINTATVLEAQSIGFAIPINRAKRDIEQVSSTGKIVYPFLGVRYTLVTDELKKEKNLLVDYGAFVSKNEKGEAAVLKGSAADKAGLKEDDVILEFNGEKITKDHSLLQLIDKYNPGDKVSIKILRDEKEQILEATLGERTE